MPPAACRSTTVSRLAGANLAISGVCRPRRSKVSGVMSTPAPPISLAMAGRWSAALVEPPSASVTRTAFSRLAWVSI